MGWKIGDKITVDPGENDLVPLQQGDNTRNSTLARIKKFLLGDEKLKTTAQTITGAINENAAQMSDMVNNKHYLTYKSVAGSISQDFTITNDEISVCERMGTDICICPHVNITSATDNVLVTMEDSRITEALDRIKASQIKPVMIKAHITLNWNDDFNRISYAPSDIPTFFTNWTNIMLHYASICNTYNIPILCISCEMTQLTVNNYSGYWQTLYNTIKSSYPSLQIIHAPKVWEFIDDNHEESLQYADILSCNLYLHYTSKIFIGNTIDIYEDIAKSFYNNEYDIIKKINERCNKYNKKFYVTEIGCMGIPDGLVEVTPKSYVEKNSVSNDYIQSSLMEGFFKYFCNNENIIGFSWWHLRRPFDFWSSTETRVGETIMITYVKGGLV